MEVRPGLRRNPLDEERHKGKHQQHHDIDCTQNRISVGDILAKRRPAEPKHNRKFSQQQKP